MKHRHLYSSLVISSFFLLGACSSQSQYTGGAELERNIVQMVRIAHPVSAEQDGSSALSDYTIGNLDNFASTNNIGYGDVVMFDPGADVSPDRIDAITKWAYQKGATVGETGTFGSLPAAGKIMVYVERYTVTAPDCQRWTRESLNDPNNAPGQQFGCTDQSNLAAMIANPRDLITGKRDSANPNSTVRAAKANRTADGGNN